MSPVNFLADETGAITVDWAVLAAVVAGLALSAAGVLGTATDSFSRYNARELALQNAGGVTLLNTANYTPEDSALYDLYVAGLTGLTVDQLDALAGFANRMHAMGRGTDLAVSGQISGCGGIGCLEVGGEASDFASINDFLVAIDNEYADRGVPRPTHTRIDRFEVVDAFNTMGLSQNEINGLWSS